MGSLDDESHLSGLEAQCLFQNPALLLIQVQRGPAVPPPGLEKIDTRAKYAEGYPEGVHVPTGFLPALCP